MSATSTEDAHIEEFVDHATIGPKTMRRLDVQCATDGSLSQYQIQNSVDDGFIRLYTNLGHRYWVAQAEAKHLCPDWKIHVSVHFADVPRAWNIVGALFVKRRCRSAMKAVNLESEPPAFMRGREITIYLYRYSNAFSSAKFYDPVEDKVAKTMGRQHEQGLEFWLALVGEIEALLAHAGVRPRGLAQGDRTLGTYCSLRNEAFVSVPSSVWNGLSSEEQGFYDAFRRGAGTSTYPPNALGYNAARHRDLLLGPARGGLTSLSWLHWPIVAMAVLGVALLLRKINVFE